MSRYNLKRKLRSMLKVLKNRFLVQVLKLKNKKKVAVNRHFNALDLISFLQHFSVCSQKKYSLLIFGYWNHRPCTYLSVDPEFDQILDLIIERGLLFKCRLVRLIFTYVPEALLATTYVTVIINSRRHGGKKKIEKLSKKRFTSVLDKLFHRMPFA